MVVVVVEDVVLVVAGTDVLVVSIVVEVVSTVVDVVASVVLVEVGGGTVVLLTLVEVVVGTHASGSQVPGPRSMPFWASHCSGATTSQVKAPIGLSKAPPTEVGTQHWISGQVQQLVPVPTVPPRRSHCSAERAMPQWPRFTQVTASSRPQVELSAQRMTAPRHRRGTSSRLAAFATHTTWRRLLVASSHGHCSAIAAWAAQRTAVHREAS
jgi:hypothetical protein